MPRLLLPMVFRRPRRITRAFRWTPQGQPDPPAALVKPSCPRLADATGMSRAHVWMYVWPQTRRSQTRRSRPQPRVGRRQRCTNHLPARAFRSHQLGPRRSVLEAAAATAAAAAAAPAEVTRVSHSTWPGRSRNSPWSGPGTSAPRSCSCCCGCAAAAAAAAGATRGSRNTRGLVLGGSALDGLPCGTGAQTTLAHAHARTHTHTHT